MRISIPDLNSRPDTFNDEDTLFGPDNQIARTLDPERRLVVFSRNSFIEVVHWPTNAGFSIDTRTEDMGELVLGTLRPHFQLAEMTSSGMVSYAFAS
jgi:hypothetical protein